MQEQSEKRELKKEVERKQIKSKIEQYNKRLDETVNRMSDIIDTQENKQVEELESEYEDEKGSYQELCIRKNMKEDKI